MHKDYYNLLGINKKASKEEIKKVFHKLAKRYHPDNKTTGDEQKFKEVNEAYQTLSDDKRRLEYDTYGHVFSGGGPQGPQGFGGFEGFPQGGGQAGFDFGDIFSEFFGGGGTRAHRGSDISINLEIPFTEATFGTERKVLLAKTGVCQSCQGKGGEANAAFIKCNACNGKGRIHETRNSFLGSFTSVRECHTCKGDGKTPKEKCRACRGLGIIKQQEEITIRIPAGMKDGEVIRLSGMGEAVSRGVTGDLYIKVHVTSHSVFRREGNNLVMDLQIKLSDALLGGEYSVQLLDNSTITLKIPEGVSFGEVLRVRGKGIPIDRGRSGDLLVHLKVQLPKHLSKKVKELLSVLKKEGI